MFLFFFYTYLYLLLKYKKIRHGKDILQPEGFGRGHSAIKKLSKEANVNEKRPFEFLKKQAVWQMYLPAPKKIVRPRFDVSTLNEVHQADLLFLPHDTCRKTYKYALTVVDIGRIYKETDFKRQQRSCQGI